jgi:hypothetical protein
MIASSAIGTAPDCAPEKDARSSVKLPSPASHRISSNRIVDQHRYVVAVAQHRFDTGEIDRIVEVRHDYRDRSTRLLPQVPGQTIKTSAPARYEKQIVTAARESIRIDRTDPLGSARHHSSALG